MPALSLSRAGARVVESADLGGEGAGRWLAEDAWERLKQVKDPRSGQGRIYPLPCLLAIAVWKRQHVGIIHTDEGKS